MKRPSDRAFGLTFAALFAAVFAVGWAAFGVRLDWAAAAAALLAVAALGFPGVLLPLNVLWSRLAARLAILNNYLLLGVFYYLLLLPVGALMRLWGRDPLARKLDPQADTYWTAVRRGANAETLHDQF